MQIAQWSKASLVLNVRGCWFKSCWCHFSWLNDKYLYFHGYLTCGSGSPVPYYSHRSGFQFWKYVNPQVRIQVTHGCTRVHPYVVPCCANRSLTLAISHWFCPCSPSISSFDKFLAAHCNIYILQVLWGHYWRLTGFIHALNDDLELPYGVNHLEAATSVQKSR